MRRPAQWPPQAQRRQAIVILITLSPDCRPASWICRRAVRFQSWWRGRCGGGLPVELTPRFMCRARAGSCSRTWNARLGIWGHCWRARDRCRAADYALTRPAPDLCPDNSAPSPRFWHEVTQASAKLNSLLLQAWQLKRSPQELGTAVKANSPYLWEG